MWCNPVVSSGQGLVQLLGDLHEVTVHVAEAPVCWDDDDGQWWRRSLELHVHIARDHCPETIILRIRLQLPVCRPRPAQGAHMLELVLRPRPAQNVADAFGQALVNQHSHQRSLDARFVRDGARVRMPAR